MVVVGHLSLPLIHSRTSPLMHFFFSFVECDNLPLVRWFWSTICYLSRLVIGLANLEQYMKFGFILGVMNRSGVRLRV